MSCHYGNMDRQTYESSMRLFATEVLPKLRAEFTAEDARPYPEPRPVFESQFLDVSLAPPDPALVTFVRPTGVRNRRNPNTDLLQQVQSITASIQLPDSLAGLEQQRSGILTQILQLGDFRSGSITAINGRCGKPNCHCHQPNQPGHGPNFRLTRKIDGKTVSESFSSAAELRKAQREVEAFHRFRQLSQDLLEVNQRICRVRPVADTVSPEEKKRRKRSVRKSRAK